MQLKNKRAEYISYDQLTNDKPSKEQLYSRLKYHLSNSIVNSQTIDKIAKKYNFTQKQFYNLFEIAKKDFDNFSFNYQIIKADTICTLVYHMSNVVIKSLPN